MASDVDICNLALGRLGDDANVTTINAPDDSAQAGHCQRFYPMARDSLLEMEPWSFATTRVVLAPLVNMSSEWEYVYAYPNNCLDLQAIYDPQAPDDIVFGIPQYYNAPFNSSAPLGVGVLTPANFTVEALPNGSRVIYTNQDSAVARIKVRITDTTKFSPLFVDALAWLLASYLGGPVLKGETGVAAAKGAFAAFMTIKGMAATSDAQQTRKQPNEQVIAPWMVNR